MPYKNKEDRKKNYQKNRETILKGKKESYHKNKEKYRAKRRRYYFKNKEKITLKSKKYYQLHKKEKAQYDKEYRKKHYKDIIVPRKQKNRLKIRETMRIYRAKRIKNDPHYKLSINLRNRLLVAIKSNQKSGSAIKDLGCTIPELKTYLEKQFQPGMTWDNWGVKGWHIDHRKALSLFDLTDRKQFLEACNYTNLQPLWWFDNLLKRFI